MASGSAIIIQQPWVSRCHKCSFDAEDGRPLPCRGKNLLYQESLKCHS